MVIVLLLFFVFLVFPGPAVLGGVVTEIKKTTMSLQEASDVGRQWYLNSLMLGLVLFLIICLITKWGNLV